MHATENAMTFKNMIMQSGLVNELCQPLFNKCGIKTFTYTEINSKGEFLRLSSNREIYERFVEEGIVDSLAINILKEYPNSGYYLDDLEQTQHTNIIKNLFNSNNIGHFFCIVEKEEKEDGALIRIFRYGADINNSRINHFYINNLELMLTFNRYFVNRMRNLLNSVQRINLNDEQSHTIRKYINEFNDDRSQTSQITHELKINLNSRPRYRYIHDISKREKQIIDAFLLHMNSNEIADQLHISKRTVEKHFENIFRKLKCNSKLQLLKKLQGIEINA